MLRVAPLVNADNVLLREDFTTLKQWKPLTFPKIERHSSYEIEKENDGEQVLKSSSNGSASGLIWKDSYNVFDYPRLRWRWKVRNVYEKGNGLEKAGDDYPIRVYVIFQYDPKKVSFWKKTKYETAKLLYGEYPPDSTVNYIWANRSHKHNILSSPYTDSAKLVILQSGASKIGEWVEEEVDVLKDYQLAFGRNPPKIASLAIMNDSDNTGESSVSYVDFIEILPPK